MVLGGQELDELEHWVSDLFSSVPSGKGARPTFFGAGMPYQVPFTPFLPLPFPSALPHSLVMQFNMLRNVA